MTLRYSNQHKSRFLSPSHECNLWAAVRRRLMLGFAEMIDGGLNGWLAIGILEVFLWGGGDENLHVLNNE